MHNYSCFFGFIGREPEMTRHESAEESHGSLLIVWDRGARAFQSGLFIGREPGMTRHEGAEESRKARCGYGS